MKYLVSGLRSATIQQFSYGKLLLLTLVLLLTITACNEEEAFLPIDENTAEVFENSFVEDLSFVLEMMEKDEAVGDYIVLQISKEKGALRINKVTFHDAPLKSLTTGGPVGPVGPVGPGGVSEKPACEGTGRIKFAKCVDKWLDDSPGKCLTIARDENGNNTADLASCP
jgi:hypothetical protein